MKNLRFALAVVFSITLASNAFAAAVTITIVNKDGAGVGFNDPTPAAPIGGNAGTTLGQQRLNVFQDAANIWAAKLSTVAVSPLNIKIAANFGPLTPCSSGSGVIGSAGPTTFRANFSGAPRSNVWYPVAMASALSGTDFAASLGLPDLASIEASFNSSVGTASCLTLSSWYLGLDGNEVGNAIDLEATLLHEFGHGLGFLTLVDVGDGVNPATGALASGLADVWTFNMLDNSTALHWNVMTNAQRLTSMVNNGNVVWDGANATAAAATVLSVGKDGSNHPKLFMPSSIQVGSTASHIDTTATPNQLMEPVINHDLTHNVDVPNDLTNSVFKDMGWPQPSAVSAPTNVTVTGATNTQVNLSWTAAAGVTGYRVYRSNDGSTFTAVVPDVVGGATVTYSDTTVSQGKAYLYKVRGLNGGTESGDSNKDLGYAFTFTDATITIASTRIKAAHITELRTAVNAVRQQLTALGAATFTTDPTITATTTRCKRLHIIELRTALDAARAALSLPAISYTDTTITANVTGIRKVHITDLRGGVQ